MPYYAPILHDHFLYAKWSDQCNWNEYINMGSIGQITRGAGDGDKARGTIDIESGTNAAGDECALISIASFRLGGEPWSAGSTRLKILSGSVDQYVMVGFFGPASQYAAVIIDLPLGQMTFDITDGVTYDVAAIPILVAADKWYNIGIWITGAGSAEAVVNGGTPVALTLQTPSPSVFGDVEAAYRVRSITRAGGAASNTVTRVDSVTLVAGNARYLD
jgi:hypothetical protein